MKKNLLNVPVQPVGMYAVFRHTSKLKRAHFCSLHESYALASAECVRLLAHSISENPDWQHTYYAIEIAGVFSGGVDGLRSAEK